MFSIVLSMIPIIYLLSNHRYQQKLNRYFLYICISNIFMIIGDLGDWTLRGSLNQQQQSLLAASTVLYYVASAFVLCFFACYMDAYLGLSAKTRKWFLTMLFLLCSIQAIFALCSPLFGSLFYVTSFGYERGNLFLISQFVPMVCYLLFTYLVVMYKEKLNTREVVFFLLYIFVPLGGGMAQMFLRGIAVINIGITISLLCILVNIQFERELLIEKQEQALTDMHIDIMLSHIQPHFLRCNMNSLKSKMPIPFEQELRHAVYYLNLEKQRFLDCLSVKIETPVSNFSIPSLTLQPLVENAVRHGLMMKEEGGTVTIQTKETTAVYTIIIADDGVGFDPNAIVDDGDPHIGIQNVRELLKTMCGASLQIISTPDKGTNATITLVKKEMK